MVGWFGLLLGCGCFLHPSIAKIYSVSNKIDLNYNNTALFCPCLLAFFGLASLVHRCDNVCPLLLPCVRLYPFAIALRRHIGTFMRFPFCLCNCLWRGVPSEISFALRDGDGGGLMRVTTFRELSHPQPIIPPYPPNDHPVKQPNHKLWLHRPQKLPSKLPGKLPCKL